jgi:hypothetical protein
MNTPTTDTTTTWRDLTNQLTIAQIDSLERHEAAAFASLRAADAVGRAHQSVEDIARELLDGAQRAAQANLTDDGYNVPPIPALQPPISDTFRRIRNILDVCPQSDWSPDEAKVVLAALSSILRGRQGVAAPAR